MVFPLHVSQSFDVRLLLKENQSLACLESRWMCWEPQHRPYSPWLLRNLALLGAAPFLLVFFPLIQPHYFPSQGLFHLELLEIPLSVERHPSVALSSHFRQTYNSVQTEYDKHLDLSGAVKWLLTGLGRKYFDRRNVYALRNQHGGLWIRDNIPGVELSI